MFGVPKHVVSQLRHCYNRLTIKKKSWISQITKMSKLEKNKVIKLVSPFCIIIMASETKSNPHPEVCSKDAEQSIPKTLEDFGYKFNEKGELRSIKTDEPYKFNIRDNDREYNQKTYEALGNIVTEYTYKLLESETKLKRHYIPENAEEMEAKSFIFMSEDALTNPDKLLILIHGSGAVTAGQWSRKLIINGNIDKGTQLPYIREGIKQGYGILVLNTNINKGIVECKELPIRENKTPEEHGLYVWKQFVQKAEAENIAIVAHSYGGVVTLEMANSFPDDFKDRVFGIGFTDSAHSFHNQISDESLIHFFKERAINYVSSDLPLGTPQQSFENNDCVIQSAGTESHELTSWSCFELLFPFLQEKYTAYGETHIKKSTTESDKTAAGSDVTVDTAAGSDVTVDAAAGSDVTVDTSGTGSKTNVVIKSEL